MDHREEKPFQRDNYHELQWIYPSSSKYDDSNRHVFIKCCKSGTFNYYFTIDGTA